MNTAAYAPPGFRTWAHPTATAEQVILKCDTCGPVASVPHLPCIHEAFPELRSVDDGSCPAFCNAVLSRALQHANNCAEACRRLAVVVDCFTVTQETEG